MKELIIRLLDFLGLACWIEIKTNDPQCVYYFGPFLTSQDAPIGGYLEDLNNENALGITVKIKRFKPQRLTIFPASEAHNLVNPLLLPSL